MEDSTVSQSATVNASATTENPDTANLTNSSRTPQVPESQRVPETSVGTPNPLSVGTGDVQVGVNSLDNAPGETANLSSGTNLAQIARSTETTELVVDPDAMRILEAMFQAYHHATAYADHGFVQVTGTYSDGEPLAMGIPMVSVLTRPNRIRLETYATTIVSNGTEMIAFIADYPGQVMRRAAPDRLTVRDLFTDPILTEALTQGAIFRGELGFTQSVTWLPPPLLLLLDEDPARTLFDEATKVETLPPIVLQGTSDAATQRGDTTDNAGNTNDTGNTDDTGNIAESESAKTSRNGNETEGGNSSNTAESTADARSTETFCHQVKITRRDGSIVLRIDAKTHLLRQMDFPVGDYGEIRQMLIRANFEGAAFVEPDSPTLFAWEIPEGIPVVERLQPPREPAAEIIGKPAPHFSFTNLAGDAVTHETCADRPLLVTFWATDSADSLDLLDFYGEIAEKYRDRIRILAVNVDPESVPQEAVDVKWRQPDGALAGTLIGVRDTDLNDPVAVRFGLETIPTTFLVGTDGRIQDILTGLPLREREKTSEESTGESQPTNVSEDTSKDTVVIDRAKVEFCVDSLLAGNELGAIRITEMAARQEELLRSFAQFEQRYAAWLETWLADGRYRFTETLVDALTQSESPEISAPESRETTSEPK